MHEYLELNHPAAMISDLDGKVFSDVCEPTGYHVRIVMFMLA